MKLHLRRRKPAVPGKLPEAEEREALKYEREHAESQSSLRAIFKKMGRENLDGPFRHE